MDGHALDHGYKGTHCSQSILRELSLLSWTFNNAISVVSILTLISVALTIFATGIRQLYAMNHKLPVLFLLLQFISYFNIPAFSYQILRFTCWRKSHICNIVYHIAIETNIVDGTNLTPTKICAPLLSPLTKTITFLAISVWYFPRFHFAMKHPPTSWVWIVGSTLYHYAFPLITSLCPLGQCRETFQFLKQDLTFV